MHPVAGLDVKQVPMCKDQIHALNRCHSENSFIRKAFLMVCNDAKLDLDKCLRADKERRYRLNQQKSKQLQYRLKNNSAHSFDYSEEADLQV